MFGNREGRLPRKPYGYYREYTVPTPGSHDRGARRIIAGKSRGALLHGQSLPKIQADRRMSMQTRWHGFRRRTFRCLPLTGRGICGWLAKLSSAQAAEGFRVDCSRARSKRRFLSVLARAAGVSPLFWGELGCACGLPDRSGVGLPAEGYVILLAGLTGFAGSTGLLHGTGCAGGGRNLLGGQRGPVLCTNGRGWQARLLARGQGRLTSPLCGRQPGSFDIGTAHRGLAGRYRDSSHRA